MIKKNKTTIIAEPGKQELFIKREFNAPRELVFYAITTPELVEQWSGPKDMSCKVEIHAEKAGQQWRFINVDKQGNQYYFSGVVHEITSPERIIRTFEFEGLPEKGHVSMEILTLEIVDVNRTLMIAQSVFRTVEDRDAMIQSGMETGVNDSNERLENLLEELK